VPNIKITGHTPSYNH